MCVSFHDVCMCVCVFTVPSSSVCLYSTCKSFNLIGVYVCALLGSAVADVEQKDVEVDESLFQDLEDLELEGQ